MQTLYNEDLAYIHDGEFGQLADNAAIELIGQLHTSGVNNGLVVDLGCGSGISALRLRNAAYTVLGIDISSALLERARQRVSDAQFMLRSFVNFEIPPCVAVLAAGEVLNYAFDANNHSESRADLFQRIHQALSPGGILLFDMATTARGDGAPYQRFFNSHDWFLLLEVNINLQRDELTRNITTFRKQGDLYRRAQERHILHLVEEQDILHQLVNAGFYATQLNAYHQYCLPQGLCAFVAKKEAKSKV